MRIRKIQLGEVLKYEQPTKYIVESTDYKNDYEIPVLTAGKSFILGYTNETQGIFEQDLPVIIFDDFTTATKFVDFPFKVKSSAMKILKTDRSQADTRYLFYQMQYIKFDNEEHKRFWISKYSKIKIPLPPLPQQKKIASILDAADQLRQKDKALIKKYEELTQSLFLEMFGDPVTNPMGWEKKELKSLTSKIGSGATPRGGKEAYKDAGISLIRSLNVYDNFFKHKNLAFIDEQQADKLSNVTVEINDVLFNITGASICRCTIVPSELLPARVNQHVSILRAKIEKLNPVYLNHFLISENIKKSLLGVGSFGGAVMEAITKSQLENLEINTPSIHLQNQFADRVKEIEQQKVVAQNSLAKSEELFNSLLQKAFKGEIS